MEVHLDLVGGLAGDMFIAALLDAFPQHEAAVATAIETVSSADMPVVCALQPCADGGLTGRRFHVSTALSGPSASATASSAMASSGTSRIPLAAHAHPHAHAHASWAHIRRRLQHAALPAAVIAHAVEIFRLLAAAEASVHGIEEESVAFHEVGAWDSIADIVGAAALIEALGVSRWSYSPVPLGGGRVQTAHGVLPVPAPATARLLTGMTTLDDGVGGERVTPTGAAILRYLCPPSAGGAGAGRAEQARVRKLIASGTGFGSRRLPQLSNHVRALCFEPPAAPPLGEPLLARGIEVLEFEIDDQSGEDLAAGLDRLRAHAGVLDVTQAPVVGKKGRIMIHVQVLARAALADAVIEACFRETTTLGLRQRTVRGVGLERHMHEVDIGGQRLRVKVADRPGGRTAKAESDDVLSQDCHAHRAALRRRAETEALTRAQLSGVCAQLSDA